MDEPHKAYPLAHGHPRHNRHSKPKPSPLLPIFNCLNGLVRSDPPFCYCHTEVEGNKCQFSTTSLPSIPFDSVKSIQLLGRMGHPWDHPIHLSHPEGEYLRGLICKVL